DAWQPAQHQRCVAGLGGGQVRTAGIGGMLLDVRVNRRTVVISGISGAVVLAAVGGGVAWQQQRGQSEQDRAARTAAQGFARAWSQRKLDGAGTSYSGASPAQVASSFTKVAGGLGTGPVAVTV